MTAIQVSVEVLRDCFNKEDFAGRIAMSRLRLKPTVTREARPALGFAPGTMSVMADVLGPGDELLAQVHYYMTPDGVIEASGLYDPKGLKRDNGDWWYVI